LGWGGGGWGGGRGGARYREPTVYGFTPHGTLCYGVGVYTNDRRVLVECPPPPVRVPGRGCRDAGLPDLERKFQIRRKKQ
jgi:hypothetical protein